jgi:hypothetical protein
MARHKYVQRIFCFLGFLLHFLCLKKRVENTIKTNDEIYFDTLLVDKKRTLK